jgi:uncharacterized protein (DUF2062 family)
MLAVMKYLTLLCWSSKVEARSVVFVTMRSVLLLLGGANLDVVIFYSIWMPVLCPLFLMHILLSLSSGVVVRVFSRVLYEYGTLCI